MKSLTTVLSAALSVLALAAAQTTGQTSAQTAAPATDGTWTLSSLTDRQGTVVPAGPDTPTLNVQGEQISGFAGCNTFTTSGALTGQTFRFGPLATTRKFCAPEQNALETRVLNVLAQARAFARYGDTLILTSGTSKAVFKMAGSMNTQTDTGLTATWRLVGAQGGEPLTLTFGKDGRVSGNTGCNSLMGEYDVMDDTLTFGPLGVTRRACPDAALAQQEQSFLKDLSEVTDYEVAGTVLKLTTGSGKVLTLARSAN